MGLPLVVLRVLVPDGVKRLIGIGVLEGPAFWDESLEEDVGLLGVESHGLHDFADARHSVVALVLVAFLGARWV